jgi:hypothetical protein
MATKSGTLVVVGKTISHFRVQEKFGGKGIGEMNQAHSKTATTRRKAPVT